MELGRMHKHLDIKLIILQGFLLLVYLTSSDIWILSIISPTVAWMNVYMQTVKIIPTIRCGQLSYLPTKILYKFNLHRLLALSISVYPAFRLPAIVKLPRPH
jgi:hypothetical protein